MRIIKTGLPKIKAFINRKFKASLLRQDRLIALTSILTSQSRLSNDLLMSNSLSTAYRPPRSTTKRLICFNNFGKVIQLKNKKKNNHKLLWRKTKQIDRPQNRYSTCMNSRATLYIACLKQNTIDKKTKAFKILLGSL